MLTSYKSHSPIIYEVVLFLVASIVANVAKATKATHAKETLLSLQFRFETLTPEGSYFLPSTLATNAATITSAED